MQKINNWWNNRSDTTKGIIAFVGGVVIGFGVPAAIFGFGKKDK